MADKPKPDRPCPHCGREVVPSGKIADLEDGSVEFDCAGCGGRVHADPTRRQLSRAESPAAPPAGGVEAREDDGEPD